MQPNLPIWRRSFWKWYWVALRRSPVDRRSRAAALRISFLLIYLLAYGAFLSFFVFRVQGGAWLLITIPIAVFVRFVILRSHKRQEELLRTSITGATRLGDQETEATPAVRAYLEERAIVIAALMTRAGGEVQMSLNELSAGVEVITRQTQNALLRERGLWNRLEGPEAELMSAADGTWSQAARNQALIWCEQLRLLRWTLRVDPELTPLAHFPQVDFSLARNLRLGQGEILRSWDLRTERDTALGYLARVIAELKGRGFVNVTSAPQGWADQVRADSLGASRDLLCGAQTVGDLDEGKLRLLGSIAAAREQYARYLVEQLSLEEPIPFVTSPSKARP